MKIHDDPSNVRVTDEAGCRARAVRCPVLPDHWWVVELVGEGDHAGACMERLLGRLRERHAEQVNVEPGDVRPDLGRPFYASTGFQDDLVDEHGRYPMLWRPPSP